MNRKCASFTDSVIRRMTRIAYACGAINLAQGFPDFDPPKAITDRLKEVAAEGPHQYPVTMGAPTSAAPWPPRPAVSWAGTSTRRRRWW